MATNGKPKIEIKEGVKGTLTDNRLKNYHLKEIHFLKQGKELTFEFYREPGFSFELLATFVWSFYNINGGRELTPSNYHSANFTAKTDFSRRQEQWNTKIKLNSSDNVFEKIVKIEIRMTLKNTNHWHNEHSFGTVVAGTKPEEFNFVFEKDKSVSAGIEQGKPDENPIETDPGSIEKGQNVDHEKQHSTQIEQSNDSRETISRTTKDGCPESHTSERRDADRAGIESLSVDDIKAALIEDNAFKQALMEKLRVEIDELKRKIEGDINYTEIKESLQKDEIFKNNINQNWIEKIEALKNECVSTSYLTHEISETIDSLGKWVTTDINKILTENKSDIEALKACIPKKLATVNIYHQGMQRLLEMVKSDPRQQEADKRKERLENGKTAVALLEKLLEQIPEKDQNSRHREKVASIKSEIAALLLALCSPKKAYAKLVENLLKAGENPGPVPEIEEDHPDVRHLIEAYGYEVSLTGKPYWKEYEDYKGLLRDIGESKNGFDAIFLQFVKNRLFDFIVHALAAIKKEMEKVDSSHGKERENLFSTLEAVLMSFGGIEKIRWKKQAVGPQGNAFFEVHGREDDSDESLPGNTILLCLVDGYMLNWADKKVLQRAVVMTKRGIN